jgi:hypothetical protein
LIINSVAQSGQYNEEKSWNGLIEKLNKIKKIATTEKIEGVPCTRDDKLSIKDIAAISTKSKKIIMVNSGVAPGIFNKYTLENVDVIYFFDYNHTYIHPKLIDTKKIEDLYFLEDETEGFSNINHIVSCFQFNNLIWFFILFIFIMSFCFLWFRKRRFFRYKNLF